MIGDSKFFQRMYFVILALIMLFLKDPISDALGFNRWLVFAALLAAAYFILLFAIGSAFFGSIVRIVCAVFGGYILYNAFFLNLFALLMPAFPGVRIIALMPTVLVVWFLEIRCQHTKLRNLISGTDQYEQALADFYASQPEEQEKSYWDKLDEIGSGDEDF